MLDAMLAYIGPSRAAASCNCAVRAISSCCSRSARATGPCRPRGQQSAAPIGPMEGSADAPICTGDCVASSVPRASSRASPASCSIRLPRSPRGPPAAPAPRFWKASSGVRVRRARPPASAPRCRCAAARARRRRQTSARPSRPIRAGPPACRGRRQPCRYPGLPGDIGFNRDRQGSIRRPHEYHGAPWRGTIPSHSATTAAAPIDTCPGSASGTR